MSLAPPFNPSNDKSNLPPESKIDPITPPDLSSYCMLSLKETPGTT